MKIIILYSCITLLSSVQVWDIMRSYISKVEGKDARLQKKLSPVAQLLRATPVKRTANFNLKVSAVG